jgi:hypothetical protein
MTVIDIVHHLQKILDVDVNVQQAHQMKVLTMINIMILAYLNGYSTKRKLKRRKAGMFGHNALNLITVIIIIIINKKKRKEIDVKKEREYKKEEGKR